MMKMTNDPNNPLYKYNFINPTPSRSGVWTPSKEFINELEIYKLKSETKPRKVNMMQSQVGAIQDFCTEEKPKKLYVPGKGGNY